MSVFSGSFASLSSVDIVVIDPALYSKRVQYRFPRSRARRIRKKWARDPRNFRTVSTWPKGQILQMGRRFYTDHETFMRLQLAIQAQREVTRPAGMGSVFGLGDELGWGPPR